MYLEKVEITKFRNFENIIIDFKKNKFPKVFSIASANGGGKSTLLQFIFILLRCFDDKKKHSFLKNLLSEQEIPVTSESLSKFTILHEDNHYELDFLIYPSKYEDYDFDNYIDLKDAEEQVLKLTKHLQVRIDAKLALHELQEKRRISPSLKHTIKKIISSIPSRNTSLSLRMLSYDSPHEEVDTYIDLLHSAIVETSDVESELQHFISQVESLEHSIRNLRNRLVKNGSNYITHLQDISAVLILKSNMPKKIWSKLSNKVFLTAPSTQIFHFLPSEIKSELFESKISFDNYENCVRSVKDILHGFSTYDFTSTDIILKSFEKAFLEDRKAKLQTNSYGNNYDTLAKELNEFLEGKEISVDENFERVIFKLTSSEKHLSPEDLSHGELKKLGIYIWVKYIVEDHSIVLMDEVDIALHPKWQYQIINDLTQWAKTNQFIVATHSPQIISSTYHKNIIKLKNVNTTTEVIRFNNPPIDRDINAIISTIMDAPDFPVDLLILHKKYRVLIDEGMLDSNEAKTLKENILEFESEQSSFFQSINFDLELMQ